MDESFQLSRLDNKNGETKTEKTEDSFFKISS